MFDRCFLVEDGFVTAAHVEACCVRSRPSVPATTKWRPNPEIACHHDRSSAGHHKTRGPDLKRLEQYAFS